MKHKCFGNWEPGKNCQACIEAGACKASAMAPTSQPKPVEKKAPKRGRPKKTESAMDVAQSDSTEIEE